MNLNELNNLGNLFVSMYRQVAKKKKKKNYCQNFNPFPLALGAMDCSLGGFATPEK